MKIFFILITILFLSVNEAYTQCGVCDTKPIIWGVKAGINRSDLYTKDAINTQMITGFNLGLFYKMPITKHFGFQPELFLSTKGAYVSYNNPLIVGKAHFNLTYLEIPLLYVFNFSDYFDIQVGPYVSFLLNEKVKNEANMNLYDLEKNMDINNFNRIDGGIALGAEMDFGVISVGGRYNLGITTVGKEQTILGTTVVVPDAKNEVINFYISVSLN